jgi:quercetin dioxygenase-like cupin family protein
MSDAEWREGVLTRMHASSATGAEQLCVMEQFVRPGAGAPIHTHFEVEEAIGVIGGEAEFTCDGTVTRVAAGEAILLPARSWHGFVNVGDVELHTYAVFASARPPVEYVTEPGRVYVIGTTGGERRDAHRALRED